MGLAETQPDSFLENKFPHVEKAERIYGSTEYKSSRPYFIITSVGWEGKWEAGETVEVKMDDWPGKWTKRWWAIQEFFCWHMWMPYLHSNKGEYYCIHCGKWRTFKKKEKKK